MILKSENSVVSGISVPLERFDSVGSTDTGDSDSHVFVPKVSGDLDSEMASRFVSLIEWSPSHDTDRRSSPPMTMVTKAIKILRVCRYDTTDISTVLAVTYMHHNTFRKPCSSTSSPLSLSLTEQTFLVLAQIYIAHCVVLDECCKVSNWHKYLFTSYCGLSCLNKAISKVLARMDFSLWTDPDEVTRLSEDILFGLSHP